MIPAVLLFCLALAERASADGPEITITPGGGLMAGPVDVAIEIAHPQGLSALEVGSFRVWGDRVDLTAAVIQWVLADPAHYTIASDQSSITIRFQGLPYPFPGLAPPNTISVAIADRDRVWEHRAVVYGADDWAYQLQGYDPHLDELAGSAFDLVVMDYSTTGGADGEFSAAEIARVREGRGGRKLVLAYLSIGEAESYRYYFDPGWIDPATNQPTASAPSWLFGPNPDYPDNYKVRYWETGWRAILFGNRGPGRAESYLDRILDAGFDGVYLDLIDAYEFFGPDGSNLRPQAAHDMAELVMDLARYARNDRARIDFVVAPQNGSGILDRLSTAETDDYLRWTQAIGAEDTFYFGDRDENNPLDIQVDVVENLRRFRGAGNLVLAIDYLTQQAKVDDFFTRCAAEGFLAYTSVRALDRLKVPTGHPPD